MNPRIAYTKPSITELEVRYATDAAANGWGAHCYDYIHRFEGAFARRLGVEHTIATSSCTGALHMGLFALGLGAGDEVILADTNWVATVAPVVHLGARPVFVDILPDTWCIAPDRVEAAITPHTKAIIVTHLYGNVCDMDALLEVGARRAIPIIEDAAEAIGSQHRGRHVGALGAFATFSFHGTKTLTTGEGGMFVTNDEALHQRVLTLSNHGRARTQTKQFWPDTIGFKYKMSNIEAALGCAQLERVDMLVERKREVLGLYRARLGGLPGVTINPEPVDGVNGAWMPAVVFEEDTGVTRERLATEFAAANIDARVFFHPLSSLDMFDDRRDNVHAWSIPTRAMNLPSFHDITPAEIDRVVSVVERVHAARA